MSVRLPTANNRAIGPNGLVDYLTDQVIRHRPLPGLTVFGLRTFAVLHSH